MAYTQNKQVVASKQTGTPTATKQNDEDEDQNRDEWHPTPEVFEAFLKRDLELATSNLVKAMTGVKFPMTLRDLKDCLLHSVDVIERVLTSLQAAGRISTDDKGRYLLVA
jgi:hypothetical protein